jgi:hypothetical protein
MTKTLDKNIENTVYRKKILDIFNFLIIKLYFELNY